MKPIFDDFDRGYKRVETEHVSDAEFRALFARLREGIRRCRQEAVCNISPLDKDMELYIRWSRGNVVGHALFSVVTGMVGLGAGAYFQQSLLGAISSAFLSFYFTQLLFFPLYDSYDPLPYDYEYITKQFRVALLKHSGSNRYEWLLYGMESEQRQMLDSFSLYNELVKGYHDERGWNKESVLEHLLRRAETMPFSTKEFQTIRDMMKFTLCRPSAADKKDARLRKPHSFDYHY